MSFPSGKGGGEGQGAGQAQAGPAAGGSGRPRPSARRSRSRQKSPRTATGTRLVDFPGEEGPAADNPIAREIQPSGCARRTTTPPTCMRRRARSTTRRYAGLRPISPAPMKRRRKRERPRRERRPRRQPPPAPDLPAGDLARRYSKGLKSLSVRGTLVLLLFIPALYLSVDLLPYPEMLTSRSCGSGCWPPPRAWPCC